MAKEVESIKRFKFESREELIEYFDELDAMQMNEDTRSILADKYGLEHRSQIGGVWVNEWGGWLFEVVRIDGVFYASKTFNEKYADVPHAYDDKAFFERFTLDELYMMVLPNEDGSNHEESNS